MCKENTEPKDDQKLEEVPEAALATGDEENINEIGSSNGRDAYKDINS